MGRLQAILAAILLVLVCAGGLGIYKYREVSAELQRKESALARTLEQLANTKSRLVETEIELSNTRASLDETKAKLLKTKNKLTETEAKLSETKAALAETQNKLTKAERALQEVRSWYDSCRVARTQLINWYLDVRDQVNRRLGIGNDACTFVTPEDPMVVAKVRQITGGFSQDVDEQWKDFKQMYDWVIRNVKYSRDTPLPVLPYNLDGSPVTWTKEYWRTPKETIEDKAGDCEDMALLLTSMLLAYNRGQFSEWVIQMESPTKGHLAAAFPVKGGKLTILDAAANYYTSSFGYLTAKDVSTAVNEWLAHLSDEMPGAHVAAVFSDGFYETFTSTEQFINWVTER